MLNAYHVLLLFALLLVYNVRHFRLRGLKRSDLILVAYILATAFCYIILVPNVLRVYGDEPAVLYASIHYNGGIIENMAVNALYQAVYAVFGINVHVAIYTNIALSALILLILAYTVYLTYENRTAMYASVVVLSVFPPFVASATSAYTAIIASFFMVCGLASFALFIKKDRISIGALSMVSLILMTMSRFEYILILASILLWWIVDKRRAGLAYWGRHLPYWAAGLGLYGTAWYLPVLLMKYHEWDTKSQLSLQPANILGNIGPGMLILSALLIAAMLLAYKKKKWIALAYILACISMLLLYAMNTYMGFWYWVPLSVTACLGGSALLPESSRLGPAVLVLGLAMLSASAGYVESDLTRSHAYFSTGLPALVNELVPAECTVIVSYHPNINMGSTLTAVSLDSDISIGLPPCTYFVDDYLCYLPEQLYGMMESCMEFRDSHELEKIATFRAEQEGRDYSVYKIK